MYVEMKNIYKKYGNFLASDNVSFGVEKGKLVALLGPSGSGKTTLLRMIAGLETPNSGDIYIDGKRVNDIPAAKRGIGFVFQNYSLMPVLNVYDNVALPVTFDCGKHINRKYIEELLRELGIWEKRKKYPNELSGGQQQRVAIARALANKPSILLCDEPTGNLDSATTIEVMGLLKTSCRKYNQTILMVTHNEAIAQTCDRVIHIEDGQIVTGKRRFPAKGGDVVC